MAGIWDGVIAFGLVSIPVKLHSATRSHDRGLHQYHASDEGRIRYQKVCELDAEVVPEEEIVKGVEADGEVVLLDDEDFDALPVSTSKTIEVLEFVPGEQIDPIHYERSYYAEPGKAAARPYVLLREALSESGKIAVVKITLRRRESLAVLRPRDDLLLVHTMMWPDEIREPAFTGLDAQARAQELEMADALIESLADDFRPDEYSDDYQEALAELIEAKQSGRKVRKRVEAEPEAKVINLMDALKKSVEHQGGGRPAKKTAKKAAKKAAGRKSTAKKATARKRKSA
ncbi:non-homologous end joining protein Ku [Glycomyces albidus]|uniref:Non-homologous end joining protein Ku n=1 Tax=Glycomyces albidus TaxID=2656774 RepID=A0A6L5G952_9ACTN|nr:Ku protein [Glycomyces albidus]MQM26219.1 Ku protein [Glycomyces albidus]